ncbi:hypothetical protein TRIP_C60328 [Candidatus Zixiibacteriota bacterium]|nr:hypothetical protein TRIP_C60328 [candidate division Zixibacteria bacterium]
MIHSKLPHIWFLVGIMLMAGCATEKKEVRLAFKFRPNQKRQYSNEVKVSSKTFESGRVVRTGANSYKTNINEDVVSLADSGQARIRLTDIIEVPSRKDSELAKADPRQEEWSLEYLMAPNGKVLELYPSDSLSTELVTFYKNYYEQALPVFPQNPVSEGYSWSQSVKLIVKNEGTTRAETTYRVRALVREAGYDCAVIEYQGNLVLPFRGTDKEGALVIKLERINSDGKIYFAYREGMIVRQEETYTIESEGTRSLNGATKEYKETGTRFNSLILTAND